MAVPVKPAQCEPDLLIGFALEHGEPPEQVEGGGTQSEYGVVARIDVVQKLFQCGRQFVAFRRVEFAHGVRP